VATETEIGPHVEAILKLIRERASAKVANGDLTSLLFDFLNEGRVRGPFLLQAVKAGLTLEQRPGEAFGESAHVVGEAADALRARFRASLTAVLDKSARAAGIAALKDDASRMVAAPRYGSLPKDVQARWSHVPLHFSSLLSYLVLELIDEAQSNPKGMPDFAECEICSTLFQPSKKSSAKGRRRRDFCSDACMLKAQSGTTGERSAASRAGVSVAVWRTMTEEQRVATRAAARSRRRRRAK
jgi:hypothetical protein